MRLSALGLASLMLPAALAAATFPVTKTADTNDGACDADCSLREAIVAANAAPGFDTISFAIPGAGPHTISPGSPFPDVTDRVLIDGYTQPGASFNTNATGGLNAVLMIELNGAAAGVNADGLRISSGSIPSGGSSVSGLVINRFGGDGTEVFGGALNLIRGNYIGTNIAGTAALPNIGNGVSITGGINHQIGGESPLMRNLISGNDGDGVHIEGATTVNLVFANLIGTDVTGNLDLGNGGDGVAMEGGTSGNNIGSTFVPTAGRNVISGNAESGVEVLGPTTGTFANLITGNHIGTNAAGTAAIGNGGDGIFLEGLAAPGGSSPGAGNLISGNGGNGIRLSGSSATVIAIQGNRIGTDAAGTAPLPNQRAGVSVGGGANNNLIGTSGGFNIIAFNATAGVAIDPGATTVRNSIQGNRIFGNGALGIDLSNDGVTPNDPNDLDAGPNDLQNFPIVTSAARFDGATVVSGTLNSTPLATFSLEFFASPSCDPSGNGEGQTPLGFSVSVTTDAAGNGTFSAPLPVAVTPGQVITATATRPLIFGNTSEFSPCVVVAAGGGPTVTPTTTQTATPTATRTATPTISGGGPGIPANIPTLDPLTLAILALALAAIGWFALRRSA